MAKSKKSGKSLVTNQPLSKIAFLSVVGLFAFIGVAFTVSSFALSVKSVQASITINKTSSTSATFSVQQTKGKASSLWVSNVCLDGTGKVVVAQNQPVVGEENGGLGVTADTFTLGGVVCNAYVWAYPNAFTQVSPTFTYNP